MQGTGDEAAVMQAMTEMQQRQDDELMSSDNDRYSASSDDEVVVGSALQLQLQQFVEQPQRLQEPPERDEKAPHRSTAPPDGATRRPPCVSGGGLGLQRKMLEHDDNSSTPSERGAKRGGLSSPTDARIHMR